MRLLALTAAALLASATTVLAAPASVNVAVGPELQKKFEKTYGLREAEFLTKDLRESVTAQLAKKPIYDGARVELVLTDVKPNRPTFKQLGDTPGLSFESFGVGGAAIEGRMIAADGTESPIKYQWFETDIRQSRANWIWSDAEWTFDRFARRLARGQEVAGR
ncbi:MAG: hypothetical protein EPO51_06290 [Phenylobacterium sp.]|uniref:hypothetical protein n=1 Tax=Phenylobacterium sp. TaxID=1871053 RepID=UPI00120D4F93|nr:hypothetical protein [Phenylobacterium sp.]TAJ73241.1 MAG: hypothetical protein EPO51_06290 [Phenylobacterium sp.]